MNITVNITTTDNNWYDNTNITNKLTEEDEDQNEQECITLVKYNAAWPICERKRRCPQNIIKCDGYQLLAWSLEGQSE